jgi:hypothetical protein
MSMELTIAEPDIIMENIICDKQTPVPKYELMYNHEDTLTIPNVRLESDQLHTDS